MTNHFPVWDTASLIMAVVLAVVAALYLWAWRLLSRKSPRGIPVWRGIAFLTGLALLWVAWSPWLSRLTHYLLIAHMVQHLLFMLFAPPLLLLGSPVLVLARGLFLPSPKNREHQGRTYHTAFAQWTAGWLTHPVAAGSIMVAVTIAWHIPGIFALAMGSPSWHTLENLTFLGSGILFWWPVILPWPSRKQWPRWTIPIYLLGSDLPVSVLTAYLAFCGHVVYPAYLSAPRLFGITALDDQVAAAMLMWVAMLVVFLAAAVAVVVNLLEPALARSPVGGKQAFERAGGDAHFMEPS